jgi:hypothetical protein
MKLSMVTCTVRVDIIISVIGSKLIARHGLPITYSLLSNLDNDIIGKRMANTGQHIPFGTFGLR